MTPTTSAKRSIRSPLDLAACDATVIEGTRSFGVGLARAVAAAGLTVIECEQPNRKARRGTGISDPIDAHLAVLAVLRRRRHGDRGDWPSHRDCCQAHPAP